MFERVIKIRIEKYMMESGNKLLANQYGFVKGRSTVDAITKVKQNIEEKLSKGLEVIAVSLDIKTAFNSIK